MRATTIASLIMIYAVLHAGGTTAGILVWGNDGVYRRDVTRTSEPTKILVDGLTNIVSVSAAQKRIGVVGLEKGSLSADALGFFVFELGAGVPKKLFERRGLVRAGLSPDGNRVAYLVCHSESCELLVRQVADASSEAVMASALARGSQISWNPDSRQVAVENDAGSVEVVDVSAKTRHALVKGGNAVWSPDGKRLAYVAEKAIWTYDFGQRTSAKVYQRYFWQSNVVGSMSWGPNDVLALNVAAGIDGKEIECLLLDVASQSVAVLQRGYLWCGPWLD